MGRSAAELNETLSREGQVVFLPTRRAGRMAIWLGIVIVGIALILGWGQGWSGMVGWRIGLVTITLLIGLAVVGLGIGLMARPGVPYLADPEGMTLPHLGKVPWRMIRGTEEVGSVHGRAILIDEAWGRAALAKVDPRVSKHFEQLRSQTADGSYAMPLLSSRDAPAEIVAFIVSHARPHQAAEEAPVEDTHA